MRRDSQEVVSEWHEGFGYPIEYEKIWCTNDVRIYNHGIHKEKKKKDKY